jgi:hypothetical protein
MFLLAAAAQEIHNNECTVQWTASALKAFRTNDPRHPVLDMQKVAAADWKSLSADPVGKNITASYDYQVLSLVGPVLSLQEEDYCDCGGAHPTAGKQFRAIDLNSGKPALITSTFPAETVFQALGSDAVVNKALPAGAKPATLDALVKSLTMRTVTVGECDYYFPEELLSRFAFYDVKGDRVAVRFSLSHASEICRGQMTQIGVELAVPSGLDRGLVMAERTAAMKKTVTVFEFSTSAK